MRNYRVHAWLGALGVIGALSIGPARAGVLWGVEVAASVNGPDGQSNVVGTGSYSPVGTFDRRTAVSTSASSPYGSASSYADLSTGKAGLFSETPYAASGSSVAWIETVSFDAPGLTALTIPLALEINGSFGQPGNAAVALDVTYTSTTGTLETQSLREALDFRGVTSYSAQGNWTQSGLGASTVADIDPLQPVSLFFNMGCVYNCDFAHTATFGWTLPAGVTYTSASGAFLTAAQTPGPATVPEPGSFLLLGVGTLASSVWRRR
jgi:hypothetical protein